jgi:Fur family transcriptional regulator, ferric uptake regulator
MNDFSKALRHKGHRYTIQRQEILNVLTKIPQSVFQVYESLIKSGIDIDKVTVYRTLDYFTELGIVGKIQFQEKVTKYELIESGEHHHHLVCNKCGKVEDIPLNDEDLINKIGLQSNFKIISHSLEFFGLCHQCQ